MLIYIIRHGETQANKDGLLQGWLDTDLNELGIELAKQTGYALKDVKFDITFTSPLKRAVHTAELILRHSGNTTPIVAEERIKEVNVGRWQGKYLKSDEIPQKECVCFFNEPGKFEGFPGGETIPQLCGRTQGFLKELAQKDYHTVLVSTHGAALRAMLNCLYENKEDFWHGHPAYNCAVNIISVENGTMKLIADDQIYYDKDLCVDRYAEMKE